MINFPSAPPRQSRKDFLVDRLRNGDPTIVDLCPSKWADPLDAAILAALLLHDPVAALTEREQLAKRGGQSSEAAFWRAAGDLLATITLEEFVRDPA